MDDLDWVFNNKPVETKKTISARMKRAKLKRQRIQVLKRENVDKLVDCLPKVGESFHLLGNGAFDCWTLIPLLIDMLGGYSDNFYSSTWTMNLDVLNDLFSLFDGNKIGNIRIISSLSFKRRKTDIYTIFLNEMERRGQAHLSIENHSKITLLNDGSNYIVVEGSANMTANPRLEQITIINDKGLWEFHKGWMDEVLNG